MIKRKRVTMTLTVTGPVEMTAKEIRREVRNIIRDSAYDDIKMHSITPAGIPATLYNKVKV